MWYVAQVMSLGSKEILTLSFVLTTIIGETQQGISSVIGFSTVPLNLPLSLALVLLYQEGHDEHVLEDT